MWHHAGIFNGQRNCLAAEDGDIRTKLGWHCCSLATISPTGLTRALKDSAAEELMLSISIHRPSCGNCQGIAC